MQHEYHLHHGVLYRNLQNTQQISEGLIKTKGNRKQASLGALDSRKARRGDTGDSGQDQHSVDLTNPKLLFKTDRMLTKFEIPDSSLAVQIEKL